MRTIKFRAWDKTLKIMWFNVQNAYDTLGRYCEHSDSDEDCDCKDTNYPSEMLSFGDVLENEDLDVMQFTGLLDKNGVEIFEGDIVKNLKYPSLAQVVWEEAKPSTAGIVKGMFGEEDDLTGFLSGLGKFNFKGIGGMTKAFYKNEFEVIGNIYESPELLK